MVIHVMEVNMSYYMTGVKGAPRIVFEELRVMLNNGVQPSVRRLAERTYYTERTVFRAMADLRAWGLVRRIPTPNGHPARYELCD
jgi:DNA-binding IclR family transcriptional regulator